MLVYILVLSCHKPASIPIFGHNSTKQTQVLPITRMSPYAFSTVLICLQQEIPSSLGNLREVVNFASINDL